MRTRDRLAAAIKEVATEERHLRLASRAARGEFDDFSGKHLCPVTELHKICCRYGLFSIAARIEKGEFDATKEESDEWARSDEAQELAKTMTPEMRALLGLELKN